MVLCQRETCTIHFTAVCKRVMKQWEHFMPNARFRFQLCTLDVYRLTLHATCSLTIAIIHFIKWIWGTIICEFRYVRSWSTHLIPWDALVVTAYSTHRLQLVTRYCTVCWLKPISPLSASADAKPTVANASQWCCTYLTMEAPGHQPDERQIGQLYCMTHVQSGLSKLGRALVRSCRTIQIVGQLSHFRIIVPFCGGHLGIYRIPP